MQHIISKTTATGIVYANDNIKLCTCEKIAIKAITTTTAVIRLLLKLLEKLTKQLFLCVMKLQEYQQKLLK